MNNEELQFKNKKPYTSPEVLTFQSLKEITLAITCNCDYWGNHSIACDYCVPSAQMSCPDAVNLQGLCW